MPERTARAGKGPGKGRHPQQGATGRHGSARKDARAGIKNTSLRQGLSRFAPARCEQANAIMQKGGLRPPWKAFRS